MPYADVGSARDAILGMFKTAWEGQGGTIPPVAYDDVPFDIPASGSAWIRLQIKHNLSKQATLGGVGGRRFRKTGLITAQVFTPFGKGLTASDAFVKVIVGAFEGKTTKPDGVNFYKFTSSEIGQSGDWFQTNIVGTFEYDVLV